MSTAMNQSRHISALRAFIARYGLYLALSMTIAFGLASTYSILQMREGLRAMAVKHLSSDFPSAINRQAARDGFCSYNTMTVDRLIERGLMANTVWDDQWSVEYTSDAVEVTYPTTGAADPQSEVEQLAAALTGQGKAFRTKRYEGSIVVAYPCL